MSSCQTFGHTQTPTPTQGQLVVASGTTDLLPKTSSPILGDESVSTAMLLFHAHLHR